MSKKQPTVKTELSVKAGKIKVKATQKAQKIMLVASSLDVANTEAFRRAEMKVIKAIKETDEDLNALQAKIDSNSEKGATLREQYANTYKANHPAEFAKETCLREIKSALISWLAERKEVTVNGVVVKTYADARAVYQAVVEQKQVAVATNTQ